MTAASKKHPARAARLNELTASEIARGTAAGDFTCEAVLRDCLARIAEREPAVQAWVEFDPAPALAQAQELDRGPVRGPLHGVPLGVKDVIDTFDLPTQMGSPIYRVHRPAADAACVALARAAGAVILGKTVTCEFAGVTPGATTNPHDCERTPGGSSSGSGAAVADHMVPAAFGTQTGGSVLRPASFCGVIGFKPTFNAFNRVGVKPAAEGLDTIGLIARSLEDVALLRSVLVGDAPTLPLLESLPRIGLCRTPVWEKAQPETVAAIEDAAKRLGAAGARVSEIALPDEFARLKDAREVINNYERAMAMAHEWTHHRELISERLQKIIADGFALPYPRYLEAVRLTERCRARLDEVFGDADLLLAPCVNGEAPKGLAYAGDPSFQALWTQLHTPTLSLPTHVGPNGLPVGIQLVARRYEDERLLAATGWVWERLRMR
jgi:amidase